MKNSKLLQVLRSLSLSECNSFREYVNSPYFHPQEKVSTLLELLLEFAPHYDSTDLTLSSLSERIFPAQVYDAQKMREQMSFLYRRLKAFLVDQELQSRTYDPELFLLAQLRKRNLDRVFSIEKNALEKRLASTAIRDDSYHWCQHKIAHEAAGQAGQQERRIPDHYLSASMYHLDVWYYILKLRGSTELLNRQKILNTDSHIYGLDMLTDFLDGQDHPYTELAAIQVYREVLRLIQDGEESSYLALKEWLNSHQEILPQIEMRSLYKHAQNYCIRQINKGKSRFEKELLRLYKEQLQSGLILDNGNMAHTDFKNIVTVALREQDHEWVQDFLTENKERVVERYRDNVFNFCTVSYLQAIGDTQQAIRLLNEVAFTDVYYQLSAKHLLLRCYYEQEDWDALAFLVNSFQHFLKRNKDLSAQNRTNHLNFLKFFRKLLALQERKGIISSEKWSERTQRLGGALEQAKQTAHLGWLREEVGRLE